MELIIFFFKKRWFLALEAIVTTCTATHICYYTILLFLEHCELCSRLQSADIAFLIIRKCAQQTKQLKPCCLHFTTKLQCYYSNQYRKYEPNFAWKLIKTLVARFFTRFTGKKAWKLQFSFGVDNNNSLPWKYMLVYTSHLWNCNMNKIHIIIHYHTFSFLDEKRFLVSSVDVLSITVNWAN